MNHFLVMACSLILGIIAIVAMCEAHNATETQVGMIGAGLLVSAVVSFAYAFDRYEP
jgi:hypothetical protein